MSRTQKNAVSAVDHIIPILQEQFPELYDLCLAVYEHIAVPLTSNNHQEFARLAESTLSAAADGVPMIERIRQISAASHDNDSMDVDATT
jgi:hypothetical protein